MRLRYSAALYATILSVFVFSLVTCAVGHGFFCKGSDVTLAGGGPPPGGDGNIILAGGGPPPGGDGNIILAGGGPPPGGDGNIIA